MGVTAKAGTNIAEGVARSSIGMRYGILKPDGKLWVEWFEN